MKKIILTLIITVICFQLGNSQIYVDVNASGSNNGSSWANAYNHLNTALANSSSGNEIRVAQGDYYPDLGTGATLNDRNSSFTIPDGVIILGGYNATTGARNINTFPTILNGDLQQNASDADYAIHIITISAITTTIDGFSVTNGNANASFPNSEGGAIYINTGFGYNLTINQCTFENNLSTSGGAAIRMPNANSTNAGILSIDNSFFNNNSSFRGGAIKLSNHVTLSNSTFDGNTARFGGAMYIDGGFSTITNCTFSNNSITIGGGGAIYTRLKSVNFAKFIGCNFTNNSAPSNEGGAITIETATGAGYRKGIEVEDCTFTGNTAQFGAAIRADNADNIRIINSTFDGNIANSSGGGIGIYDLATGAQPFISGCTFTNNSASGVGGNGVFLQSTNATVVDCLFDGNGSGSGFDGTIGFQASSAIVSRCILINNNAGRIIRASSSGSPTISNCLIANNTGRAIDVNNSVTLRLENNTIVNNGSGIQNLSSSSVLLYNNILWGNTPNFETFNGAVDFNIIEGGFPSGTNIISTDPMFEDASNGNYRLQLGSPGIDSGNNAYTNSFRDLDSNIRLENGFVDMGAYEFGSSMCPTVTNGIIYVDASNTNNFELGTSWEFSFTSFQEALVFHESSCGPISEIRVAEGTYLPDDSSINTSGDRTASFVLPTDVTFLGGFPAGGGNLSTRDFIANLTILSGDIGTSGNNSDNTYNLIITQNVSANTIIDGFIIEKGIASQITTNGQRGGAWRNFVDGVGMTSEPQILNCIIRDNEAITEGGAIFNLATNEGTAIMNFRNCQFLNNSTTSSVNGFGGAIFNEAKLNGNAEVNLTNCFFQGNNAQYGGAIRSIGRDGGSGFVGMNIINTVFYQNTANSVGGVYLFNLNNTPNNYQFVNNTFYGNSSSNNNGSGINAANSSIVVSVINSIFWANTGNGTTETNQVFGLTGMELTYSHIQENDGTQNNNSGDNPLFIDGPGGNLRLQLTSTAIDTGLGSANTEPNDIEGNDRVFGPEIDRGAYETTVICTDPTIPVVSATPANVCPGSTVTLSLTGTLNDATTWQWYSGSCGGTSVGTGTSITVNPTSNTTYFARGIGGCVTSGTCASVAVTANDTTAPVISCVTNPTVDTNIGVCQYTVVGNEFDATFTDNCTTGVITNNLNGTVTLAGEILVKGNTTVIWTVDDGNGQTVTCTTIITVEDNENPIITCVINTTVDTNTGGCGYTVVGTVFDASFTDNCTSNTITNDFNNSASLDGAILPLGATDVLWTVDDGNGNIVSCTTIITVESNLIADFESSIRFGCGPLSVNFTDLSPSSCLTIVSWSWDFGDGNTSTIQNPDHIYDSPGIYHVSLTVIDALGNSNSIIKNNYIQVIGPDVDFSTPDPTSSCDPITVNFVDNTIFGAPITSWTWNFGDGNTSNLQNPTHTYTTNDIFDVSLHVTDIDGCARTLVKPGFIVTLDTIPPTAVCIADFTLQLDENGEVSITEADINNGTTDNCGIGSITLSQNTFNCTNIGANNVVLTAIDIQGNISSCVTVVTVEDNINPTWVNTPADLTVECDGSGNTTQFNDWLNNTFTGTDNCLNPVVTHNSTGLSDLCGATETVTFTLDDGNGNTITQDATFTIEDTTAPLIACPADVTTVVDISFCGAVVFFGDAIGLDDCGSVIVVQTGGLGSGSFFPVGDTVVEFTATDECFNTSTCSFVVTVIDDVAPVANCNNLTIQLDEFGNASITADDVDAVSTDNCGVDFVSIDIDTFDCSNVGDNNVTLTVTDVNGNQSTCTAVVTVVDITAPEITCNDISVELDADGTVTIDPMDIAAGSSDACGIASYELNIDTFGCLDVGDSTVILTVTDVNGNESSCSATVTVEDNTAPVLVCMDVSLELNQDGIVYIIPSELVETISDPCGVLVFTADVDELYCADIGTPVTVNIFANDGNGNSSFCSSIVTVVDLLAPQIVCPDNEQVNLDPNGTYTLGDYIADGTATATDNCTDPVTIFSQDPAAGTSLGFGVHTITFTAEDQYGNVSTCSFELDVEEILGANDADDFASLVVYPNPANNQVNLSNPKQMELSEVLIYDLTGRIVNKVDLTNMGSEISIDVSNLANATYLLVIKGTNGISNKQLIVNNY